MVEIHAEASYSKPMSVETPIYALRADVLNDIRKQCNSFFSELGQVVSTVRDKCKGLNKCETVEQLANSLKEVGFDESVIEVIMNRWKAIDEKVGGLEVVLESTLEGWGVHIIRSASSEQVGNDGSSIPPQNTTTVVDKAATHQPAAQPFTQPKERQSHSSSSRESAQIPKLPLPRLAPPPGPTWRSQVSEIRVYGKADLRDIPAVSEFVNVSRVCDDGAMYEALAGYGEERYIFHGTPTTMWEDRGGGCFEDGFSIDQSVEQISRFSRRPAVYFSNSLGHALLYGGYRSGVGAVDRPFNALRSTALVITADTVKITTLRDYGALCILANSTETQEFINSNKSPQGPAARISAPFDTAY
jgi:hypothetical protein